MLKRVGLRLMLLAGGCLVALLGMELLLRFFIPSLAFGDAATVPVSTGSDLLFEADPECGYMAVPNTNEYDEFACVRNAYPRTRTPGKQRLLFMGDSVTHQALILNELRKRGGEQKYEYWNAGVESYNTRQEVAAYERYNAGVHPDHVILTFHNNDFFMTPVLRNEAGDIRIYSSRRPPLSLNFPLFAHSYLYRFYIGCKLGFGDKPDPVEEVREPLKRLKQETKGIRLSIVLLPIMAPPAQWVEDERWSRQQALKLFKELDLKTYDLLPAYERFLKSSKDNGEFARGDRWHPNPVLSQRFAEELWSQGLLNGAPAR